MYKKHKTQLIAKWIQIEEKQRFGSSSITYFIHYSTILNNC